MGEDELDQGPGFGFVRCVEPRPGGLVLVASGEVPVDLRVPLRILGGNSVTVQVSSLSHEQPLATLSAGGVGLDQEARVVGILDPRTLGVGDPHPRDVAIAVHVRGAVLSAPSVAIIIRTRSGTPCFLDR